MTTATTPELINASHAAPLVIADEGVAVDTSDEVEVFGDEVLVLLDSDASVVMEDASAVMEELDASAGMEELDDVATFEAEFGVTSAATELKTAGHVRLKSGVVLSCVPTMPKLGAGVVG